MKKLNRKMMKTATASVLALSMVMGTVVGVSAATEHYNDASLTADSAEWTQWKTDWTTIADDYEEISINVGADESQLGFAFYTHTDDLPKVRFAKTKLGLSTATIFEGTLTATTTAYSDTLKTALTAAGQSADGTYNAAKVTVTGLKENTSYYYQVYQNGTWGTIKKYTTKDWDEYKVLYVGDPQIGACKGQANSDDADTRLSGLIAARNDSYNWNNILTDTLTQNDVNFIISAGDQVNTASNEYEYAGFLYPEVLSGTALATTIGNHDSSDINYTYHYNNPNSFDVDDASQSDYTTGHTTAGTDYYYTYGDVLYIVLDTNNYNCATHENVIKKAVDENKDCKWRIVTFHQDIYGSGADHSDSDGIVLRTQLTPLMDKYDIDIVLQGHDHTYSRSYQISSDGQTHTAYDSSNWKSDATEYSSQNNCYNLCSSADDGNTLVNPEGTVYFEQNSATGSKFYNLIANQQNYIAERSQTWTPTYSILSVKEDSISITTYDASTGDILEGSSTYTIVKNDGTATEEQLTTEEIAQIAKDAAEDAKTAKDTANTAAEDAKTAKDTANTAAEDAKTAKDTASTAATDAKTAKDTASTAATDAKNAKDTANTAATDAKTAKDTASTAAADAKSTKDTAVKKTTVSTPSLKITSTKKGKLTITCSEKKKVDGYVIYVSTNNKTFKKAAVIDTGKKVTTKSITLKKTSKKKYYVKVRAFKYVDGIKVYSKYSTVKSKKVK